MALTGDVGTGKTLLIRCLLRMLKNSNIVLAHVFNCRLSSLEFLDYVATAFGLAASRKTKGQLLQDLGKYLFFRHQRKLTTVILVDDAQGLSIEVLEEIRLLSNLETETEKVLQILLVGQHELDEKLDSFELRQLKQRIALRSHLEPFNSEETRSYIRHRLRCAGAPSEARDLFANETIERVFHHTRGVARLVKTVCENALIAAFARQLTNVPPDIVDEVAYDLRLSAASPSRAEYGKSNSGTASCISIADSRTADS